MDKIDEHVTRLFLRRERRVHEGQVVWLPALGPQPGALCPSVKVFWRVSCRNIVLTPLKTGIDEISRHIRDLRIGVVMRVAYRCTIFPYEPGELRRTEGLVAHFKNVSERNSIALGWKKLQKPFEILRVKF